MLYFAVPLKARAVARDWDRVSLCFNRCLASIFGQTNDDFRVIVALHDKPKLDVVHDERLQFLEVDYSPPGSLAEQMEDKGQKIHRIASHVRAAGGGPVMKVDADDLVSNRLAQYVADHPGHHGWYMEEGYEYLFGADRVRPCPRFHRLCGTSTIVRYEAAELPAGTADARDDEVVDRYHIRAPHERTHTLRQSVGKPLERLPFVGAMYVIDTDDNHTTQSGAIPAKRRLIRRVTPSKPVSPELQDEFSINWLKVAV